MSCRIALLVLLGLRTLCSAKHWALLVAGSRGWFNYAHQADVCHAYQILHRHGIPDENIVVMMYDDIAHNPRNPYPGIIINRVGGPDVYKGVPKDYVGPDVNAHNFLMVLTGNKEAMKDVGSGRVIESGPDDNIFVFFADHGEMGFLYFPDEKELMADDLYAAIVGMHKEKKCKKLVFYLDACYSGSMFDNLPDDIGVFATTSANPYEPAYGCCWDQDVHAYVGTAYSVKWMEDSDKADFGKETLLQQFDHVKQEINMSHVMKYGDMSLENDTLNEHQGNETGKQNKDYWKHFHNYDPHISEYAVPFPDVPLKTLKNSLRGAETDKERIEIMTKIEDLLQTKERIETIMLKIASLATTTDQQRTTVLTKTAYPQDFVCYKSALRHFRGKCFNFGEYEQAIRHVHVLSNLCEEIPVNVILAAIDSVCGQT